MSQGLEESSDLAFHRSMTRLEVFCDSSFAPFGCRGQEGVIVLYGGAPIQWESKQQPFATLFELRVGDLRVPRRGGDGRICQCAD